MTFLLPPAAWRCTLDRAAHQPAGDSSSRMGRALIICWAAVLGILCCSSAATASQDRDGHATSSGFEMPLVYKFSADFRELAKGRPEWVQFMAAWEELPPPGSAEFYHTLAVQDHIRRVSHSQRRNLLGGNDTDVYSMYPNNETFYLASLGGIHYTVIGLGTPLQEFLVALDTGSDLLWVPCDCKECSDPDWSTYGINLKGFAIYSPSNSTTSKSVSCSNSICTRTLSPGTCSAGASCTYTMAYMSANTSSSGTIVQDVLYLDSETKADSKVPANIYFGCGSTQTGSFLSGGAPNGLLGLGPDVYSVPSILASSGLTQNVFSICFNSTTAVGRLRFGMKPNVSIPSTPLVAVSPNVVYALGVEDLEVGGMGLNASGTVVFDTGSSFSTLPTSVIEKVGDALASRTTLTTWSFTYKNTLQFLYCWNATTDAELEKLSSLSFVFRGGGVWTIADPLLYFGSNNEILFACLGILPIDQSPNAIPIIGYNFMGHHEYFIDADASTFSWTPSDCSAPNGTLVISPASSPSPSSPLSGPAPSKSPSSSPPNVEGRPPGVAQAPKVTVPFGSACRTFALKSMWIQLLLLTLLTTFLHSLLMQTS